MYMEINDIIINVQEYGYLALFFCLWLGIVGLPIPDEAIVMTGGIVASLGILKTIPAFLTTFLGVVSGLTIGYFLGRIVGAPLLECCKFKKIDKHVCKAVGLINKYGFHALCLSYFFPVVRHVVPYLVGISKMPYKKYAMYSYPLGLCGH